MKRYEYSIAALDLEDGMCYPPQGINQWFIHKATLNALGCSGWRMTHCFEIDKLGRAVIILERDYQEPEHGL